MGVETEKEKLIKNIKKEATSYNLGMLKHDQYDFMPVTEMVGGPSEAGMIAKRKKIR